ncbi:hypothetical protein D3C81_2239600 [compost metagenome]
MEGGVDLNSSAFLHAVQAVHGNVQYQLPDFLLIQPEVGNLSQVCYGLLAADNGLCLEERKKGGDNVV